MNNEKKILEILVQMQGAIAGLKVGQAKLEADVSEIKSDAAEIKSSVKYLWEDIERIGDRLNVQEKIVAKRIM